MTLHDSRPVLRAASIGSILLGAALLWCGSGCKRQRKVSDARASGTVVSSMNRGVSLMGQYDYDGAVKAFEEAVAAAPDLPDASINLAIALFNRARKETGDIESAGALLESILEKDPANSRASYFKGIILQHKGDAEAAVQCFEAVVQQRPEDGVAWYLLGLCKERLGQDGQKELLRAIELRPYLVSAHYRLWQSFQRTGQTEQAAPFLETFRQLRENPLAETIELPQYNQMGDLALARPVSAKNPAPITKSTFVPQAPRVLYASADAALGMSGHARLGGFAAGDLNRDGRLDLVLVSRGADGQGRIALLLGRADAQLASATPGSGLETVRDPAACALGDFDNDGETDLFLACATTNYLFRGNGQGGFADVTPASGIQGSGGAPHSAIFLDADHDGDLDLFVSNPAPLDNQLWNNNADGGFTNIAARAGVLLPDSSTTTVLPGDLDGDRDMDLVLLRAGRPAIVLKNELLGKYRAVDAGTEIHGDLGGVLQDFNGDGLLDVVALGGNPPALCLFLGDGRGAFRPDEPFSRSASAAASWGELRGLRVADVDLDGDLDVAVFGGDGHLLLNDGAGAFVLQARVWASPNAAGITAAELSDYDGDFVPDLLFTAGPSSRQILLAAGHLTPPSTALALAPSGMRERDQRTRSPASGYGTWLTIRAGLNEQRRFHTGLSGGFHQSSLPTVVGLGGARQADYVQLLWPDGVAQAELALPAGQTHAIAELQRKISSCPVLFTWNGSRFECVTDFAGVGGLGYFVAPGEYAQPRALDHVKIEPAQLRPRDGVYEVRITEPMEETAYLDRLALQVIEHPADLQVFPDERLTVTGPPPTHKLLVVADPIFPKRATDPAGHDCTDRLRHIDRLYAYEPRLDRRFFGFCQRHTLDLDFGDRLVDLGSGSPLFLFISGYLEYPYSQTTYAATQARLGWEPIQIDRLTSEGRWETFIRDAGAFGGLARTMTVDVTGLAGSPSCKLRLTSNLEIYYDRLFLATDAGADKVVVHTLPPAEATLRRVGFAREYSPDGRLPIIYDYELSDNTAPFHVLRGAYTKYGSVTELLLEFDDLYMLVGPGDEVAVRFEGSSLPQLKPGSVRSFVLISHAYCKDMDLYTAAPQTVEPLPFKNMSRYPYPATEKYPDTENHRKSWARYNTRLVQ